jgi:hypothetical protein
MIKNRSKCRNAGIGTACALLILISAANARQASSTATDPKTTSAETSTAHKYASKSVSKTSLAKTHPATSAANANGKSAHPTATHTASAKRASSRKKPVKARGQQKIDPERAQAIQQALVREHYLSADEAGGPWSPASEDAMRRYQEDHGWQTKEVPDSRALIKLGLGPSKDGLLNPESAMTTVPDAPKSESIPPNSHSADPASSTDSSNR